MTSILNRWIYLYSIILSALAKIYTVANTNRTAPTQQRSSLLMKATVLLTLLWLAPPAFAWKMEAGNISIPTTSGTTFVKVNFRQKFDVTPIVFSLATSVGSDPATLRIRAININDGPTGSFEITIVEPTGNDGRHAAMAVHYFAIEPGSYTLDDGTKILASSLSTAAVQHGSNVTGPESWASASFTPVFGSTPAFIAQIQTMNNESGSPPGSPSIPWLTTAVDNLSASGVNLALERSESDTGSVSGAETVGYLAIDTGTGSFIDVNGGVVNFQGLATGNNFDGWDNGCDAVSFSNNLFSSPPLAFATKSSYRNASASDGGWLRRCSLSASSIGLTIDEDRDNDSERSHNPKESAGIVAYSQPFTFDSTVTPPSPDPNWKMEVGSVTLPAVAAGNTTFNNVLFQQNYSEPPLVFFLPSNENPDPAAIRVRNISTTGFEFAQVEPPPNAGGSNGQPAATAHYLAVKAGIHTLPGGINVDASNISTKSFQGKLTGGNSWETLSYRASFSNPPVILAQVQTMANETGTPPGGPSIPWLGTTISNVSTGSFRLALDRAEVTAGSISTNETIAYLAITSDVSNTILDSSNSNVAFETIRSADNITGNCTSVNFANTYPAPPIVIASLNKRDGGDGGWVRRCSTQTNRVQLRVDEDQANDSDRAHTTENAGVVVFERTFAAQFGCGPIPSTYPVYSAGDDLDIKKDVMINIGSGNIAVEEGNNNGNAIDTTLPANNNVTTANQTLPIIEPDTFPSNSSSSNQTVNNGNSPFTFNSAIKDDYKKITLNNGGSANFIGGGPFYIDELDIKKNATVNFAAGNYFINELIIDDDSTINITSQTVKLYIEDEFEVKGDDVTINGGGSVGGLVVYLYEDAEFKADKKRLDFTGVIYGPDSDEIKFGEDTQFHGAVIGGDKIEFDDDSVITYTPADAAMVGNITTCMLMFSHYAISHAGTGITCNPTDITIANHDTSHSPVTATGGTTITLSTSTGLGSWTAVATGSGSLVDSTLGDGMATYTFTGGENSVVLSFDYPVLAGGNSDTVNINVTDGSSVESEDPDLTVSLAGFIIDSVPTQLSGKPSDTGFNATTINLQAVRASDNDSSVCVPAFPSGQSRIIELGGECLNPGTCAGNQINVNGTNIATNDDNAGAPLTTSYTGVSLNFIANATTSLVLNYPDAGQMQLHARYDIPLANGNPSGETLASSSNPYVVRPLAIRIPAIVGNNAATSSGGDASFTAGVDFDFNLEGVQWQQADDTNDDGIADGFNDSDPTTNPANIADNTTTANFDASAILSTTLIAPLGGMNPALSSTSAAITNGTGAVTTNWPEVGIIEINASTSNYLGSGQNILGRSSYIGRFIPDRFNVTDNMPTLTDSCGSFSYMDQVINFTANPVITLTAVEDGGGTTQNYDLGGFWKYSANLSSRAYSNNVTTPATLDAPASGTVVRTGDTDANGQGELTITNEQIMYLRPIDPRDTAGAGANPAIPFAADLDLDFTVPDLTDADGVCFDSNNDGTCETYSVNNIGSTQLRFGRLNIGNAFGSELVNLQLPITAEYYDSLTNDFTASTGDTCTALTIAPAGPPTWGHLNLDNYQGSLSAGETTPTLSAFSGGAATLTLSAPGIGNQGSVVITPLLESGILLEQPWLQFDWDNDGNHNNDPTASATFGIFRGNDSTIYLRELYNSTN